MQNQGDGAPDAGAGTANGHGVHGLADGASDIDTHSADAGAGNGNGPGMEASSAPPPRRARAPATAAAVRKQLIGAVQRQATMVDARLAADGAEVEERDSRILGNLAKTLATLVEIGEGGKRSKDNKEPRDREDAEERLAGRIKAWARGET